MTMVDPFIRAPYSPYGAGSGGLVGQISPNLTLSSLPRLPGAGSILSDISTLRPVTPINGLASQVPVGVGRTAANQALSLGGEAASGGGGILSRLPSLPSLALREGMTPMGAAFRVGGGATLGQLGSGLVDQLNPGGQNSNVEQALQGAALGAGIGGGVGSVVPGIGTGVGALVGGGIGAVGGILGNMFGGGGGKDQASPEDVLANAIQTAGLDAVASENVLQVYETQMALAEGLEGDAKKQAQDAARQAAGQQILAEVAKQQSQAQALSGAGGPSTLALQQQAAQIFQPLAQDIRSGAGLYAQAMQGIMPNLPDSYKGIAQAQVAREVTSADKLANAYIAQAALTPVAQQLTQYQRDQQQYANQLFSQMLAQQAAGATGGGTDIASLLAASG